MKGALRRPADLVRRGLEPAAALALLVLCGWLWVRVLSPPEPTSSPIRVVNGVGPPPAGPRDLPVPGRAAAAVRLAFAGDVMQHRRQAGDDFRASYARVAPLIRGFDVAMANLEFPVDPSASPGPPERSTVFNGSPRHLDALADAGFDLLSTANNHAWDQGWAGLRGTLAELARRGLAPVGSRSEPGSIPEPVMQDVGGIRIAFLAYTFSPNPRPDPVRGLVYPPRDLPVATLNFLDWTREYRDEGLERLRRDVARARAAGAEFLVAFVHWGKEWRLQPTADQRAAAHDLIDSGCDLVVGAHPHVLQPPELYRGRLIAYSLGNLISDFRPRPARVGAILSVTVARIGREVRLTDFNYLPTWVHGPGHVIDRVHRTDPGEPGSAWRLARRILGDGVAE